MKKDLSLWAEPKAFHGARAESEKTPVTQYSVSAWWECGILTTVVLRVTRLKTKPDSSASGWVRRLIPQH